MFAANFIEHGSGQASGPDAQANALRQLRQRGANAELPRVLAEGDMVAIQGRYIGSAGPATIAFYVFRLAEGRLAEHWENSTPEAEPNPSGHTQMDGASEVADRDRTAANKALVIEFVTKALINGEQVDYTRYIDPADYVQHNSMVGDGLAAFGAFLGDLAKQGVSMAYSRVHLTVAEGNFVLTASEGTFGGKPQAFYDLFRLSDGRIVEHWDVIADMPAPGARDDDTSKF